jgi:hypothetical protein
MTLLFFMSSSLFDTNAYCGAYTKTPSYLVTITIKLALLTHILCHHLTRMPTVEHTRRHPVTKW